MVAYPKVPSGPVQTVVRSKSHYTSSTSLTTFLSQPFTPPPLPHSQLLCLKGTAQPPHLPHAPAIAVAQDIRQLLGLLQGQTILGLAENVAKERSVALRRAACNMSADQPPSCCCHEGKKGVHVDQLKGTARVCITDYHTPALKHGAWPWLHHCLNLLHPHTFAAIPSVVIFCLLRNIFGAQKLATKTITTFDVLHHALQPANHWHEHRHQGLPVGCTLLAVNPRCIQLALNCMGLPLCCLLFCLFLLMCRICQACCCCCCCCCCSP